MRNHCWDLLWCSEVSGSLRKNHNNIFKKVQKILGYNVKLNTLLFVIIETFLFDLTEDMVYEIHFYSFKATETPLGIDSIFISGISKSENKAIFITTLHDPLFCVDDLSPWPHIVYPRCLHNVKGLPTCSHYACCSFWTGHKIVTIIEIIKSNLRNSRSLMGFGLAPWKLNTYVAEVAMQREQTKRKNARRNLNISLETKKMSKDGVGGGMTRRRHKI